MYLLDTNHCSRLLQGNAVIARRLEEMGDTPVVTCAIVQGELAFMAHKSERKTDNLRLVREFFEDINVYPLDGGVADVYGEIKAALLDRFGPRERARRRKTTLEKLGFKENDLWIAATAKRHGFVVVSADGDFERMQEAIDLSLERWWRPEQDN